MATAVRPSCITSSRRYEGREEGHYGWEETMHGKAKYWEKPTYHDLETSLCDLLAHVVSKNVRALGMPKIGCGLDKLDWPTVSSMIKDIFKDTDVKITVCYF
mmetsp:Transcript_11170/g.27033  ORF Transcript_11170/g.27033 Transcript_11170/m.27033 type:complete len:102 (-) Transcript_11170:348-653(-)